ncbi:MAG: Alpha/beta hydrolase family protein, partial [Bryobacterales bacterium]|nr:Alpha/beta hydrolase family protein [Bryobacterales bacterium]
MCLGNVSQPDLGIHCGASLYAVCCNREGSIGDLLRQVNHSFCLMLNLDEIIYRCGKRCSPLVIHFPSRSKSQVVAYSCQSRAQAQLHSGKVNEMTSRRQFFQAGSIALAALVPETGSAKTQGGANPAPQTPFKRDYWNDTPDHMIKAMNSARSKRKADLAGLKSQAQADERIAFIRTNVWELIGGKLEPTPLNPTTTGVIERETYRIEKVIFESQPKFYLTAHLYIPKSGKGPYPGILAPVGHAPEGKTFQSYQTLFQNLARQGFAVLTWDPPGQGERL